MSGSAVRRKRSLRRQFKETFVAGDARTAIQYVIFDVLLPAAKDMVVEAGSQGIEKLIFGDSRRRGSTRPPSGPTGHISYNRYSMGSRQTGPKEQLVGRPELGIISMRLFWMNEHEAEEVIDRLFDLVDRYESASVADLYELVGLAAVHTDNKWGWTILRVPEFPEYVVVIFWIFQNQSHLTPKSESI